MAFIDRDKELLFLEERWREPKGQFVVLWGKRRVGKTELVKKFVSDKPCAGAKGSVSFPT